MYGVQVLGSGRINFLCARAKKRQCLVDKFTARANKQVNIENTERNISRNLCLKHNAQMQ